MNTTNFQSLSDQQCKEINGGVNIITNLLGIPVNLDLTNLSTLGNSLGSSIVNISGTVSGLLTQLGSAVGNLLNGLGNVGNLGR